MSICHIVILYVNICQYVILSYMSVICQLYLNKARKKSLTVLQF